MKLRRYQDGDRYLLWPIRIKWRPYGTYWGWHGFQVGTELCSLSETSKACIPGHRRVFGQTLHVGPLKIVFGAVER